MTNTRSISMDFKVSDRIKASIFLLAALLFLLPGCQSISPQAPSEGQELSLASDGATNERSAPILPGSCGLAVAEDASDEETIRILLAAEGELVVSQRIDDLMALWLMEGKITDAKNTPSDDEDDQSWVHSDAIRHRYVRLVFPGAPAEVAPHDLEIEIEETQARVLATTQIGNEVSPGGDRWLLRKVDNCWLLEALTYNLEAR